MVIETSNAQCAGGARDSDQSVTIFDPSIDSPSAACAQAVRSSEPLSDQRPYDRHAHSELAPTPSAALADENDNSFGQAVGPLVKKPSNVRGNIWTTICIARRRRS